MGIDPNSVGAGVGHSGIRSETQRTQPNRTSEQDKTQSAAGGVKPGHVAGEGLSLAGKAKHQLLPEAKNVEKVVASKQGAIATIKNIFNKLLHLLKMLAPCKYRGNVLSNHKAFEEARAAVEEFMTAYKDKAPSNLAGKVQSDVKKATESVDTLVSILEADSGIELHDKIITFLNNYEKERGDLETAVNSITESPSASVSSESHVHVVPPAGGVVEAQPAPAADRAQPHHVEQRAPEVPPVVSIERGEASDVVPGDSSVLFRLNLHKRAEPPKRLMPDLFLPVLLFHHHLQDRYPLLPKQRHLSSKRSGKN